MTEFEIYNQDSRHMITKVTFYFDEAVPTEFTQDDFICYWKVDESVGANNPLIVGQPNSNSGYIELLNIDGRFTTTNIQSPYFGKMALDTNVTIEISEDAQLGAYSLMGKFVVSDWSTTTDQGKATVQIIDPLGRILNDKSPAVDVGEQQTVADFIISYMSSLGFTREQLLIDPTITARMDRSVVKNTVKETLGQLGQAFLLLIYCNRQGQVVFEPITKTKVSVGTISSNDQIFETEAANKLTDRYGNVTVSYDSVIASEMREVANMKEVIIRSGTHTLSNQIFTVSPVAQIEGINIVSDKEVRCTSYSFDNNTFTLTYVASADGIADVTVYGASFVDARANLEYNIDNKIVDNLSVDNVFVQNAGQAGTVGSYAQKLLGQEGNRINGKIRGNPAITPGCHVKYADEKNKVVDSILVLRNTTTYSGGLSGKLYGVKLGGII